MQTWKLHWSSLLQITWKDLCSYPEKIVKISICLEASSFVDVLRGLHTVLADQRWNSSSCKLATRIPSMRQFQNVLNSFLYSVLPIFAHIYLYLSHNQGRRSFVMIKSESSGLSIRLSPGSVSCREGLLWYSWRSFEVEKQAWSRVRRNWVSLCMLILLATDFKACLRGMSIPITYYFIFTSISTSW